MLGAGGDGGGVLGSCDARGGARAGAIDVCRRRHVRPAAAFKPSHTPSAHPPGAPSAHPPAGGRQRVFARGLARATVGHLTPPPAAPRREGAAQETGNAVWDPLGLADLGSPATLAWFRAAELKHCRVAMAAFTGWLVATGNQLAVQNGHEGLHFPGYISPFQTGTTFADIAATSL